MDESTQEIVAATLTTNDVTDGEVFGDLLEQIDESIVPVSADGAYDSFECYQQALERKAEPVIPPRIDAASRRENSEHPEIAARNQVVREVEQENGNKIVVIIVVLLPKPLCLESKPYSEINSKLAGRLVKR